jgi:hypothetical protein
VAHGPPKDVWMVARIVAPATDSPRRNGEGPADGGIAARPSSGVPGVTRRAASSVAGAVSRRPRPSQFQPA